MTTRVLAARIVLLGIGAMLLPADTLAGSEARIAGSNWARGAVHAPVGTHFPEMRFRHQAGFPVWWSFAPGLSNDYPPEVIAPYAAPPYPPVQNFSEQGRPPVIYGPRCRTDSQKVPSEDGGERTINITRCY
jgi:hypothetical protein